MDWKWMKDEKPMKAISDKNHQTLKSLWDKNHVWLLKSQIIIVRTELIKICSK